MQLLAGRQLHIAGPVGARPPAQKLQLPGESGPRGAAVIEENFASGPTPPGVRRASRRFFGAIDWIMGVTSGLRFRGSRTGYRPLIDA